MPEMKSSGVEWIGDIPTEWETCKIGVLYSLRNEKVSDKDYEPLSVTMQGVVPQLDTAAKTNDGDNRKLVRAGDFAINSRSDRRGSCGISSMDGSVSLINTVLAPNKNMDPAFYNWLFHSTMFSDEFFRWGHGIVDDLWTTGWRDMKKIMVPVPSLECQRLIANYLDSKCAEIDSMIADAKANIEDYKALKQSIITQAVTKGLDPDVEMKDSGIQWIGEIPSDWELIRAKYIFSQRNEKGNHHSLELLSPSQHYGVIPQRLLEELTTSRAVKVKEDTNLAEFKTIHIGDYCISLRSFQGGFEYSEYEGVVTPAYQVFYPSVLVDRQFYKYLFKDQSFIAKMNSYAMSLRDGKNIAFKDFGNTYIPFPTIEVQKKVANYLDSKCAEIGSLIDEQQSLIDDLEAAKKSLIYECVTGKREIPA